MFDNITAAVASSDGNSSYLTVDIFGHAIIQLMLNS